MNAEQPIFYSRIALAAAGDEAAARAVADAMLAGVCKWFLAGEKLPLAEYLPGIAGHDRRAQKLAMRDYWLMRALRECPGNTLWPKAVALEKEIKRFETALWPAWRDLDEPPAGASALRTALFHAFKIAERMPRARGIAIPRTAKMLNNIGKSNADAISQGQLEDAVSNYPTGDEDECEPVGRHRCQS